MLTISHEAFEGGHAEFDRLRRVVCEAVGGSWPPHKNRSLNDEWWYKHEGMTEETHPGILIFLNHADHTGEISWEDCRLVAKDLEPLVAKLPAESAGRIAEKGGYGRVLLTFIQGCWRAHKTKEALTFR